MFWFQPGLAYCNSQLLILLCFIGLEAPTGLISTHLTEPHCRQTPDICWVWRYWSTEHESTWSVYLHGSLQKLEVCFWSKSPCPTKGLSFGLCPKIALLLLGITKLEDMFQECFWWDLTSHGHSDHRTKQELAQIKIPWNTHDMCVAVAAADDTTNWPLWCGNWVRRSLRYICVDKQN